MGDSAQRTKRGGTTLRQARLCGVVQVCVCVCGCFSASVWVRRFSLLCGAGCMAWWWCGAAACSAWDVRCSLSVRCCCSCTCVARWTPRCYLPPRVHPCSTAASATAPVAVNHSPCQPHTQASLKPPWGHRHGAVGKVAALPFAPRQSWPPFPPMLTCTPPSRLTFLPLPRQRSLHSCARPYRRDCT